MPSNQYASVRTHLEPTKPARFSLRRVSQAEPIRRTHDLRAVFALFSHEPMILK